MVGREGLGGEVRTRWGGKDWGGGLGGEVRTRWGGKD